VSRFQTVAELLATVHVLRHQHNEQWLVARRYCCTPAVASAYVNVRWPSFLARLEGRNRHDFGATSTGSVSRQPPAAQNAGRTGLGDCQADSRWPCNTAGTEIDWRSSRGRPEPSSRCAASGNDAYEDDFHAYTTCSGRSAGHQ
jgi:hypothetical protein